MTVIEIANKISSITTNIKPITDENLQYQNYLR